MNNQKIEEAITIANTFNDTVFTNTPEMCEAVEKLVDLARQVLAAEMPEKLNLYCEAYRSGIDVPSTSREYVLGFNSALDLYRSLIVKRDMEIAELKKEKIMWSHNAQFRRVEELQKMLEDKEKEIAELKAKLEAEKRVGS